MTGILGIVKPCLGFFFKWTEEVAMHRKEEERRNTRF